MYRKVVLCCMLFLSVAVFAQRTERVCEEYVYYPPGNMSLDDAKRIALERAQTQAIEKRFGRLISQSNTTFISNRNGESSVDFSSSAESQVKGDWIETIGQPEFSIFYEQGMLVVKVVVTGRIREIISAQIDIKAEVLCNGTDLKFARTDFKHGDDIYLYFQSPVNGYLAVYLLDEATQMVNCYLPYEGSSESIVSIEKDSSYIFFSRKHAGDNAYLVDEYQMECSAPIERNTLYIIFSTNKFAKAISNKVGDRLPPGLPFKEFHKWLAKGKQRDREMLHLTRLLTITK